MLKCVDYNDVMKNSSLFCKVRIIGSEHPIDNGWLLVEGSKIVSFGEGKPAISSGQENMDSIEGGGLTLLPGFIDLHTHGALGTDFVFGSAEDILRISVFFASHGTTSFLATTYSANSIEINQALSTIKSCMGCEPGAKILGVHLEGPWLNTSRAGAQDQTKIRQADPEEVIPYLDTGLIRLIALAPEITENHWLIDACRQRAITIAAGHSDANYKEMEKAVQMGLTQVTHCFNGMRPLHHREPGVVGAALNLLEIRCELIADFIHVHPAIINILMNAKSPEGVILITDSISPTGLPNGTYSLESQEVFCKDGIARLSDGTLAGSTITMETALRNLIEATGRPLEEVWRCSSLNAAEAIHIADRKGKIANGYDADLVILDSNLHVQYSMVEGKICYQR